MHMSDTHAISLRIDPEFRDICPKLRKEELDQLEANLLRDACRDPLVAWNGIIVDGHNRFEICTRLKIPFTVKEIEFEDRTAATLWIIDQQKGRRNLTPEQLSLLRGTEYEAEKQAHGGARSSSGQSDQSTTTAERLAKKHRVSARKIRRDAAFTKGVKLLGEVAPEVRAAVLQGGTGVTKEEVAALAELDPAAVPSAVAAIKERVGVKGARRRTAKAATNALPDAPVRGDLLSAPVASASLDLVFTRVPSGAAAGALIAYVAAFGKRTLKAGGSLLVLIDPGALPFVIAQCGKKLTYRWTTACVETIDAPTSEFSVRQRWHPLVWFVNGPSCGDAIDDVIETRSMGREGGTTASDARIVEILGRFSKAGDVICDPLVGDGSVIRLARRLGRTVVGVRTDEIRVATANPRVSLVPEIQTSTPSNDGV